MEQWQDKAIILGVRPHGENGAIVSLLTAENGRQAGYMRGSSSSKNRGSLEVGSIVDANWQTRVEGSLGTLTVELVKSTAARIMNDPLKLSALQSACSLCDQALPEKEGHSGLYQGLYTFFNILDSDVWGAAYVIWEIALLRELGFSLDLSRCAGGGDAKTLAYISPKSGCAVSLQAGEPYKHKLLSLPIFLTGKGGGDGEDVLTGLFMTGHFLENWVFAHHRSGIPEARQRLLLRFAERFAKTDDHQNTEELGIKSYVTG